MTDVVVNIIQVYEIEDIDSPSFHLQMISVGLDPNDHCSYYVMDYSKGPSKS